MAIPCGWFEQWSITVRAEAHGASFRNVQKALEDRREGCCCHLGAGAHPFRAAEQKAQPVAGQQLNPCGDQQSLVPAGKLDFGIARVQLFQLASKPDVVVSLASSCRFSETFSPPALLSDGCCEVPQSLAI